MSTWLCNECGNMFLWMRKGIETRPSQCPECKNRDVEVVDG